MEESSILTTVSMMWQMTVSRSSQTLKMVMASIMEEEMVPVAAQSVQAVRTSFRFVQYSAFCRTAQAVVVSVLMRRPRIVSVLVFWLA
jgi:hypothetical protein